MNKEQVYDERISPLMSAIIEICEVHDITFIASFSIPTDEKPALMCSTMVIDDHTPQIIQIAAMLLRQTINQPTEDEDAGA